MTQINTKRDSDIQTVIDMIDDLIFDEKETLKKIPHNSVEQVYSMGAIDALNYLKRDIKVDILGMGDDGE